MENLIPFFRTTGWNGRVPVFGEPYSNPEKYKAEDFLPDNVMTKQEFVRHISHLPDECLFNFIDFDNGVHKDAEIGKRIMKRTATIKYYYTIPENEG